MNTGAAPNAKNGRGKRRSVKSQLDASVEQASVDPAKAVIMTSIRKLAADGQADWCLLENGDVRVNFRTGEIYLLAEATITRIA